MDNMAEQLVWRVWANHELKELYETLDMLPGITMEILSHVIGMDQTGVSRLISKVRQNK
jgi:hypothetical protein